MKIYAKDMARILASLPDTPSRDDRYPHAKPYRVPVTPQEFGVGLSPQIEISTLHVTYNGFDFVIEG